MVTNVTSLTGNGLKDWLIQRVSAMVIGGYFVFLLAYILTHPGLDYAAWRLLFNCLWVKIASLLTVFAIVLHSWIGLWTVATDYVKGTRLRMTLLLSIMGYLSGLFVWGIHIFWGVSS